MASILTKCGLVTRTNHKIKQHTHIFIAIMLRQAREPFWSTSTEHVPRSELQIMFPLSFIMDSTSDVNQNVVILGKNVVVYLNRLVILKSSCLDKHACPLSGNCFWRHSKLLRLFWKNALAEDLHLKETLNSCRRWTVCCPHCLTMAMVDSFLLDNDG